MSTKILKSIRILLILALLLAAAVTPTLADAKTKKPAKRMKISFDSNETSAPADEPLRPRAADRSYNAPGETVRLRSKNIDDIWAANDGDVKIDDIDRAEDIEKIDIDGDEDFEPKAKSKTRTVLPRNSRPILLGAKPVVAKAKSASKVAVAKPQKPVKAKKLVVAAAPIARVTHQPSEVARPSRTYIADRTSIRDIQPLDLKFVGEFSSNYSTGKSQTYGIEGQKNSVFINEIILGFKDKSGWGLLASGSFNSVSNTDASYDVSEVGDPSVIALHPDWYKDDSLRVSGAFRYYAPMSKASKEVTLHHSSYALNMDAKLANGFDFKNSLVGRYFWQALYYEGDASMMLQDLTEVTKRLTPEFSLGVGQQTRIETHHMTEAGTRIELVPIARYRAMSKLVFEAKVFIPLVKNGVVGVAPLSAAIPNPTAMFSARIDF